MDRLPRRRKLDIICPGGHHRRHRGPDPQANWVPHRVERELLVLADGHSKEAAAIPQVFRFRRKVGEESERLVETCLQQRGLFPAQYELHGGGLGPPPRTKAFIDFLLWRERRSCGRWS